MKRLLAALSGILIAAGLAGPAPVQAAPTIVSAAIAQPGQTVVDPSGKLVKVGKTTGQGSTAPKGLARPGVASERPNAKLALTYFYNIGYQNPGCAGSPSVCGSEGVRAQHSITKPYLDTAAGDFHSLQQVWALSSDLQQGVETGWVVSQNVNSDLDAHLFVYARKNGVSPGWNTGLTLVSGAAYTPGQNLSSFYGTPNKEFAVQYTGGVWWVNFNGSWYGYFNPNTAGLWNTSPAVTFNRVSRGHTGGEIAANSSAPCTDMGNGLFGEVSGAPNTSAGRSYNWSLLGPPPGVANSLTLDPPTNSAYHDHIFNTGSVRSFYLGGPGPC